jgi:hypothetical protein
MGPFRRSDPRILAMSHDGGMSKIEVEIVKGERKLRPGEYRQRSTKVGTARLLVFKDGKFRYHDASDRPRKMNPSDLKRFMNPKNGTEFVRISPPPVPWLGPV